MTHYCKKSYSFSKQLFFFYFSVVYLKRLLCFQKDFFTILFLFLFFFTKMKGGRALVSFVVEKERKEEELAKNVPATRPEYIEPLVPKGHIFEELLDCLPRLTNFDAQTIIGLWHELEPMLSSVQKRGPKPKIGTSLYISFLFFPECSSMFHSSFCYGMFWNILFFGTF